MRKTKYKKTHEIYSGSLSMWELRQLVATVDFHYDEKRVQENSKMPHPLGFSLCVFFSLNTPKKQNSFSKLATLNII